MQIANPIYDVVFKYLLDDNRCATIFLSTLISQDVVSLEVGAQEFVLPKQGKKVSESLKFDGNIFRLDFNAKVKTKDQKERIILIEIQKSKINYTSMRFRTYLGKQLLNDQHYQEIETGQKKYKAGLPIYSIYFLGELIDPELKNIPVIKVDLEIKDHHSDKKIEKFLPFIESLYNRGILINIPALKGEHRDDLENLLLIFNQNNMNTKAHTIEIEENKIASKFQPIVRRLQKAVSDEKIRNQMELEDEFAIEMDMYFHDLDAALKGREEERRQKEEERRQKEDERHQKEEERRQKENAIKMMIENGIDKELIASSLQLPISYIDSLINGHSS